MKLPMTLSQDDRPRLLIVDDERAIRSLLESILSDRYGCTTADSAEAALKYLENQIFDVVISDIRMGGMTGIELVSHVKRISPDTVVIVVSGNAEIDGPIEAIRTGAFDYIKKPFQIDQVSVAVDRAIAHGKLLVSKRRHEDHLEQLVAERTERLNYLAYHDPLTGFPNRTSFEERLAEALLDRASDSDLTVLLFSLDRFKSLRDTLGHVAGIELIKQVAKRLDDLKTSFSVVARFEGDEFAILLSEPHMNKDAVTALADHVLSTLQVPYHIGEYEIFVTASIGLSRFPEAGSNTEVLLRHATAALSNARIQGGNTCQFYNADIHESAVKRLALENDLRRALERNELELYDQPKIDMNSRKTVGMEALVRWNHPELGIISPADFIPIAEETGLIVPMGDWILRTACTQAQIWHDRGYKLQVAVNLSACQFRRDLVANINEILRSTGFDPKFLNLEVTESSIMNNTDAAVEMLRTLRKKGIQISIDDFGTGHSSFGYLKHLPIDVLKIDKSFIDDVPQNQEDAALVMAIISLAHTLRLKVVAEGVETEDQRRFLQLMRCDEWQGYLVSKPLPVDAFEKMLTKHSVSAVA
jgi:diguanylate cyclase (GGDEF)-like protein